MKKRLIGGLLALILLFGAALPALARQQVVTLSNASDLLELAEKCRLDTYSQGLTVRLSQNIDLTGTDFTGIPIFCGRFEGDGHTISGFRVEHSGSGVGFFRYLTDTAVVDGLHLEGVLTPQGSKKQVGGIAGENAGKIVNCSFVGTVAASERVGGIAGVNTITGVIEKCEASADITGSHFVGGIAGENAGVIRNCDNLGAINTTAQQNQVSLSEISLDTLTDTESASTVTDVGGIAGTSSGVINRCTNLGEVGYRQMGYNVGGIVGSQTGSVLYCKNKAPVSGRKEVGGIVGHLEPAAEIEYSEDTLQILERQLAGLNGSINQASANVSSAAAAISGPITEMSWYVADAYSAVELLMPSPENPTLPDPDALIAARNVLSTSLGNMTSAMQHVSVTAYDAMGAIGANMGAIQQQVSAMGVTLGNASNNLGGRIEDVSDQDTDADMSGKIAYCENSGPLQADLNLGGIAGAIAQQSELNAVESIQTVGQNSMSFVSKVRAVVLDCSNVGAVAGTKQHLGGIAGYQTLGLIRGSRNTAPVGSESADYVGGIVGSSTGYVRRNSAKCQLTGATYIGGIAGSSDVATDCYSMVAVTGGKEKVGAVLGIAGENQKNIDNPIHDNLYTYHGVDYGGIDGISYGGKALGMEREDFLKLKDIPTMFRRVTVTFRQENGWEVQRNLEPGGALAESQIPVLVAKKGHEAFWEGLDAVDLGHICFDMTFDAVYNPYRTVIQSENVSQGLPVLLVQGSFLADSEVTLKSSETQPPLAQGLVLDQCWDVALTGHVEVTQGRCLIPEEKGTAHVLVRREDGSWQERSAALSGSYLCFAMDGTESAVAVAWEQEAKFGQYALIAGAVVACLAVLLILKKKK